MRLGYCTICQKEAYDSRNYKEFVILTNYGTHLMSCCKTCYGKLDNENTLKAFNEDKQYQIDQVNLRIDWTKKQKEDWIKELKSRQYIKWVYKLG